MIDKLCRFSPHKRCIQKSKPWKPTLKSARRSQESEKSVTRILWQAQTSRRDLVSTAEMSIHLSVYCISDLFSLVMCSPQRFQQCQKLLRIIMKWTRHSWVMDCSLWPGTEKTIWHSSTLEWHSWTFRILFGRVISTSNQRDSGFSILLTSFLVIRFFSLLLVLSPYWVVQRSIE